MLERRSYDWGKPRLQGKERITRQLTAYRENEKKKKKEGCWTPIEQTSYIKDIPMVYPSPIPADQLLYHQ